MSEFKVGDKLRVIRSPSSEVPEGSILEVVEFLSDEHWITDRKIELKHIPLESEAMYDYWQFELVGPTPTVGNRKYQREIKPGVFVDVYDVLYAFEVTDPCLQHLIKKALAAGKRGHKDTRQDLVDIRDSAQRAVDEFDVWGAK